MTTRRNIFQFLEQLLHVWPLYILEVRFCQICYLKIFLSDQASSQTIQEALRVGLSDQDAETRVWARKAFWAFADHFKLESDLLLSSLDQALQGDNLSLGDRASVRSRQSSIARSNESLDSLVSQNHTRGTRQLSAGFRKISLKPAKPGFLLIVRQKEKQTQRCQRASLILIFLSSHLTVSPFSLELQALFVIVICIFTVF